MSLIAQFAPNGRRLKQIWERRTFGQTCASSVERHLGVTAARRNSRRSESAFLQEAASEAQKKDRTAFAVRSIELQLPAHNHIDPLLLPVNFTQIRKQVTRMLSSGYGNRSLCQMG